MRHFQRDWGNIWTLISDNQNWTIVFKKKYETYDLYNEPEFELRLTEVIWVCFFFGENG